VSLKGAVAFWPENVLLNPFDVARLLRTLRASVRWSSIAALRVSAAWTTRHASSRDGLPATVLPGLTALAAASRAPPKGMLGSEAAAAAAAIARRAATGACVGGDCCGGEGGGTFRVGRSMGNGGSGLMETKPASVLCLSIRVRLVAVVSRLLQADSCQGPPVIL